MENDNAPATKADIAQLRNEVANNKQEVLEAIERVETTLLTEFHKWAHTYEVRARGTSTMVSTFEERLGVAEERISNLERRLPRH
jgi:hypothetical protein